MYFFNIVRHHIILIFNTKQLVSIYLFLSEVLQKKSLKVWVKCDYFEALHIEMHVPTADLNTDYHHHFVCCICYLLLPINAC